MTLRNMRANGALAGGHLRRVVVSSLNQRSNQPQELLLFWPIVNG
jgi:hypothetical protein